MKPNYYSKYIIIAGLVMLVLNSCEKVIDINIPDSERKIVINSIIHPGSEVVVNASRSLSVMEDNNFVFLDDATISLYEDDQSVGNLNFFADGLYYLPDFHPSVNKTYRIEASSPNLQSVSATTTIPGLAVMGELDTLTIADEWGGESLRVGYTIADPGQEKNRYALAITATHKVFDWVKMVKLDSLTTYPVYFEFLTSGTDGLQNRIIDDNSTVYFGGKVFITDALFNGLEFDVELTMGKFSFAGADTVLLDIAVEHVDEAYYLYALSSQHYRRSNGNPFAEPVSVYTNIDEGFGIFSGYTTVSRSLELIVVTDW